MAGLRRIYVTEQAYRMLARYCLERYGTLKGITRVASELLAEAISQKSTSPEVQETIGPVDQKASSPAGQPAAAQLSQKSTSPEVQKTTSPESQKPIGPESQKSTSPVDQKPTSPEVQKSIGPVDQKASGPAVERRELRVEVPPPRIELPGKPEPPPTPAGGQAAKGPEGEAAEQAEELKAEGAEGKAAGAPGRGPTPKQLALIESLLRQLGDDWSVVREVLLLDKGIDAPEDYRQLEGEVLDRVIKALKEWARHPTAKELRDARVRAQKLFEQGIDIGLPESTRDVLRYHLVKLELAETGVLKPKK